MSCGFIEWLLLSQELLGDDCGGFYLWEEWDLSSGAGDTVELLQYNLLDSGHVAPELAYGPLFWGSKALPSA